MDGVMTDELPVHDLARGYHGAIAWADRDLVTVDAAARICCGET
jgi:hypothetical protein